MSTFFLKTKKFLTDFLFNPFWGSFWVIGTLVLAIAINGVLWYIYQLKIKQNPVPFIFATGLILLNVILGNYLWNREKMAAWILLGITLFTQILMLVFIRYLTLTIQ